MIDEHGLDGFNLSLVARRLGVKAPSLYHHFRDKNEILAEVARIVLLDVPPLEPKDDSWKERLVARCVETRRSLLRHPRAAALILHHFPRHLLLSAYEMAVGEQPFPDDVRMAVIEGSEKFTYGSALFEAAARADNVPPMPAVDADAYPELARAIDANPFDDEALFAEALRMFLAGASQRVGEQKLGEPFIASPAEALAQSEAA